MVEIKFPSQTFSTEFDHLVAEGDDFSVWVAAEEPVCEAIKRQIGSLISLEPPNIGLIKDAVEKFKFRDLIACFADAVTNHGYKVSIIEKEGLRISFEKIFRLS